jgi:hypothetical protein
MTVHTLSSGIAHLSPAWDMYVIVSVKYLRGCLLSGKGNISEGKTCALNEISVICDLGAHFMSKVESSDFTMMT